ncbi:MAG: Hsp20/alpha crystallin family protein [Ferruginibacter sp.]
MTAPLTYSRECVVYPGGYIPLPEVEILLKKTKTTGRDNAEKLPVNMNDCPDCYMIEVIMPVVRREDIIIQAHDHILSIAVLHKDCEAFSKGNLQIHEFDSECLERHILLPNHADAEFVSAEYREGVLYLHIPKTKHPQKDLTNRIVVY